MGVALALRRPVAGSNGLLSSDAMLCISEGSGAGEAVARAPTFALAWLDKNRKAFVLRDETERTTRCCAPARGSGAWRVARP